MNPHPTRVVYPAGTHFPAVDYTRRPRPPVFATPDRRYLVLPTDLLTTFAPDDQALITAALTLVEARTAHAPWPVYTVTPNRPVNVADATEEQLATIGIQIDLDPDGAAIVHRRPDGSTLADDATVLLPVADHLTR